jgi:hypothetical protein
MTLPVEVRNEGARLWPSTGEQPVVLSYHWVDAVSGKAEIVDGARSALPRDVAPGEEVQVLARVIAPRNPGRYRLQLGMVHEHVTWFSEQGDHLTEAVVEVDEKAEATADARGSRSGVGPGRRATFMTRPRASAGADQTAAGTERPQLWRAAWLAFRAHPLTGLGPDNFRHVFGRYLGLRTFDDRLHANNLYLETLANEGLCGVVALALLLVGVGQAAARALRRHPARSTAGLLALGATTGLAAYPVHGLLDYFLMFTPTYGLAWLLAGMLAALGEEAVA